jgi:hypothetical protein
LVRVPPTKTPELDKKLTGRRLIDSYSRRATPTGCGGIGIRPGLNRDPRAWAFGTKRGHLKNSIECEVAHTVPGVGGCFDLPRNAIGVAPFPGDVEEMMYQSVSLARASSNGFTVVAIFALLGLALSLWAIGEDLIDANYFADALQVF